MRQRERQRHLFDDNNSVRVPPLQTEVAQQATRELVERMRALAKAIYAGAGDERNKR